LARRGYRKLENNGPDSTRYGEGPDRAELREEIEGVESPPRLGEEEKKCRREVHKIGKRQRYY